MRSAKSLLALSTIVPLLVAGTCQREESPAAAASAGFVLDRALAAKDLAELTRHPHPFGSGRQADVAIWLAQRLKQDGLEHEAFSFGTQVPNPAALTAAGPVASTLTRYGTNILAWADVGKAPCVVALATHFDTKDIASGDYVGANDSGSSTALLLQLLPYLKRTAVYGEMHCRIVGLFLDGEEAVLPEWSDGEHAHPAHQIDHTYGSRDFAQRLESCTLERKQALCLPKPLGPRMPPALVAVVLLDMVGSPNLQFTPDSYSTPELRQSAAAAAGFLQHPELIGKTDAPIEDDHIPFLKRGIAAIDLIDFMDLRYWHRSGDEVNTLDLASLEAAGRVGLYVAATAAESSK